MTFRIIHYDSLDSTNNLAKKLAASGASEGTVICARYQTKGRGRFNRRWTSPRGTGLLFSIILKPKINHSSLPILTLLAARAVSDTIHKKLNVRTTLKRPNDVLIGGKKVAGILTESLGNSREMTYVVIGIGVNINAKPKELVKGATSVWAATGERTKVDALLEPILRIFFREYADLNGGNRKNLRKTVEQAASQY